MNLRILWFGPLPTALIADARGECPGLEVEYIRTRSSDQQFEQLLDGSVDAAITAIDNVVEWSRRAPEGDFRAVAQMESATELRLLGRRGLSDIQELHGSQLLVDAPANGFAVALRALLDISGVKSGDCNLVPAGGVTERLEALLAGKGDATLLGPPFDNAALESGCSILASINQVWPHFPGQGLVVSRRRYDTTRRALTAWLQAASATREWMASSPDAAAELLIGTGLPAGFASQVMGSVPLSWRPDTAGIELLIEHRRIVGLVGGDLGYSDLVDLSLLDRIDTARSVDGQSIDGVSHYVR